MKNLIPVISLLFVWVLFYGCEQELTKVTPTIKITEVTAITDKSATVKSEIIPNGGIHEITRGICWSSVQSIPTISDSKTVDGTGTGSYTSAMAGLTSGTNYYLRAYATTSGQIAYSKTYTFVTLALAPELTTTDFSQVTATSFASGGNVTADGGSPVTARGICWSINQNPTIADSKTSDGTGTGTFVSVVSGLNPGTSYYVRAYAINGIDVAYGNQITFRTSTILPALTTSLISAITSTSASSGGNVTSDGGDAVTARGICWSTSVNPLISSSKTIDGTGTGSFLSSMTGLNPGITYYIRAYATSKSGTAYGNELSFKTLANLPTVETLPISNITAGTVSGGGNITSDGGGAISARGVCWSTTAGPTISDNKTYDGTGAGTFICSITGLNAGTTYYTRVYATNSAGTAYGNEVTFTTLASLPVITTIAIASPTAISASSGGNISSDGGDAIFARGVCWSITPDPTILTSKTSDGTGTGSFVSTLSGLSPGITYHVRAYATNKAGTSYGNDLAFSTLINPPAITTSALSGITTGSATGGGNINFDGGGAITARGVCWSTSAAPTISGNKTADGAGSGSFTSSLAGLSAGTTYYVRAYATNSTGTAYGNELTFSTLANLPVVATSPATNITSSTASCGGIVIADGGGQVSERGICWGTAINPSTSGAKISSGSGTGSFTNTITGLNPGITYYARAYAINSSGTAYGVQVLITTLSAGQVTDADGYIYQTIPVGTQVWMAENLKVTKYNDGSSIPLVTENFSWSSLGTGAYCWYGNSISNKDLYGAMYNWFAVQTGKLCPAGWHVPSDGDWNILSDYLGGITLAADKLKESGTLHWNSPNAGATNLVNFTALPGGYRSYSDGAFFSVKDNGTWWTSTQVGLSNAWIRAITLYETHDLRVLSADKRYGVSVRCLKD